jgi:hypothetical protein
MPHSLSYGFQFSHNPKPHHIRDLSCHRCSIQTPKKEIAAHSWYLHLGLVVCFVVAEIKGHAGTYVEGQLCYEVWQARVRLR